MLLSCERWDTFGRRSVRTLRGASVIAAVILGASAAAGTAGAQTRPEVIRGRVTTDSGGALPLADIIVTMAPNRDVFRTTSDSLGRYQLTIAAGTGDYLVYIGAVGRRALRKRVTRTGNDSVFTVDASLAREVAQVAAVRTTGQRPRPPRGDEAPSLVGGLTSQFGSVAGALSPDQMGDFNAIAATIPGIAVTNDGISAFGLDQSQNRVTVNGLTFDGSSLPRDLPTRTRVSTSIYDPTLGGFGGALIATDIQPGSALTLSNGHVTLDAPQLQSTDATARLLGQRYTQTQASYARRGEVAQDLWVYSGAVQGTRRTAVAPSLVGASPDALRRFGVSSDSAQRFLNLLGVAGIPVSAAGASDDFASTGVSGVLRLDRALSYPFGGAPQDTKPRFAIVGIGGYNRSEPTSSSILAPPAHMAHSESGNGALQLILSQYFGKDASYLSETRSAVSFNRQQLRPFIVLPNGSVRVSSTLDDGTSGINALQFGGASARSDTRTWRWEASNEVSFNPASHTLHRVKLYSQAQIDGYDQSSSANAMGTFTYNSLDAFASNSPAMFSRTLFTPDRHGTAASGAFAIADFWSPTPEWQFVFGPRVEWNTFLSAPADNPEVARVFGVHTNTTPGGVHVSPRVGFNWLYPGARAAGRPGGIISPLGAQYVPPRGVLRGGIGEFRAPYQASLVSNAIVNTGLAGTTVERVTCIGPDAPVPDWNAFLANPSSVPATCSAGGTTFTDAAPSVDLFDRSYTNARRWTGNLSWASAYKRSYYTIDASYSRNVAQPGLVDLNFVGTPAFTLSNEDDRPIYVPATSIDTTTGLVSPVAARRSAEFGRVVSRHSDLEARVAQATISLVPYYPERFSSLIGNVAYTYSHSRSIARGFDGATFGDPRLTEWAAGFVPAHQIRLQLGYRIPKINSSITTFWNFQSGLPYTPLVAGDINGDGLANDRAFVFSPRSAPTPEMAGDLATLLATTTPEARRCLERQFDHAVSRNSCRRPWTTMMNARFDWNRRFGNNFHYVTGSISFSNPLAGIDRLLHGGNGLHGWGIPAMPDPTLYLVRGFDQSNKRFIYDVNPRFGNTRPSIAALYNPFRITFDISFSLNGNVARRQVELYLRPTRSAPGVRPPVDTIFRRLRSTGITPIDNYYWMLANADSLLLSREQVATLTAAQARRRAKVDSLYRGMAAELANLPASYDADAVTKRVQQVNQQIFSQPQSEVEEIRTTLTAIQLRLLPPFLQQSLTPRTPPAARRP